MCSCSAENRFDCIVTGGGHAGSEAAVALARLGLSVLLISGNVDRLGYLSCNPAIGGLAKGHMVREIDALGGMMGLWADAWGIQFRTLNMSKGPAVRATRAQIDREAYQKVLKKTLFSTPGLRIWQDSVTEVLEENGHAAGVRTAQGLTFHARHVLLTTGSKELHHFARPGLAERCYPRVLPMADSLERCLTLGFPPKNIICMQGPFSRELNVALLRQYHIQTLVTKDTGGYGGFREKAEAAREAGCALLVVERPRRETGLTLEEIQKKLMEEENA